MAWACPWSAAAENTSNALSPSLAQPPQPSKKQYPTAVGNPTVAAASTIWRPRSMSIVLNFGPQNRSKPSSNSSCPAGRALVLRRFDTRREDDEDEEEQVDEEDALRLLLSLPLLHDDDNDDDALAQSFLLLVVSAGSPACSAPRPRRRCARNSASAGQRDLPRRGPRQP